MSDPSDWGSVPSPLQGRDDQVVGTFMEETESHLPHTSVSFPFRMSVSIVERNWV